MKKKKIDDTKYIPLDFFKPKKERIPKKENIITEKHKKKIEKLKENRKNSQIEDSDVPPPSKPIIVPTQDDDDKRFLDNIYEDLKNDDGIIK